MELIGVMVPLTFTGAVAATSMNSMLLLGFSVYVWMGVFDFDDEELDTDNEDNVEQAEEEKPPPVVALPPAPSFLTDRFYKSSVNVAIVGGPGSGKTSLVNALRRLKPTDAKAASLAPAGPVAGPAGGPRAPEAYFFPFAWRGTEPEEPPRVGSRGAWGARHVAIRLWDMPRLEAQHASEEGLFDGCLSRSSPPSMEDCHLSLGLTHFDVVFVVYAGRPSREEVQLARELDTVYGVQCLFVRTQLDVDLENELADHGRGEKEVLASLRQEAQREGVHTVFMVSAREPEAHDMQRLRTRIGALAKARQRVGRQTECPICFQSFCSEGLERCPCHWCGNSFCRRCAWKLGRSQGSGSAQCPFCRRFTEWGREP